jgi:hypothetical protein
MTSRKKKGYLYVLAHPDLPGYFKLGQTKKHPTKRLREHNLSHDRLLGKVVKITGIPWQLIYFVPVTNPRQAEAATFWYDILPRFGNIELNKGDIRHAIEDIKENIYLDHDLFEKLASTELLFYDYEVILNTLEKEWSQDGLLEKGEALIQKIKLERDSNDRRKSSNRKK